jgi:hypothetical protein
MKKLFSVLGLASVLVLSGCDTDASLASRNLSKAADMFEINRRIVFYDAIQGSYLLSIEGRCSIEPTPKKLAVTCKISPSGYKKHYLGISDNVTYFAEQLDTAQTSVYNYRVIFKPESLIPNIDLNTSLSNQR